MGLFDHMPGHLTKFLITLCTMRRYVHYAHYVTDTKISIQPFFRAWFVSTEEKHRNDKPLDGENPQDSWWGAGAGRAKLKMKTLQSVRICIEIAHHLHRIQVRISVEGGKKNEKRPENFNN